MRAGHYTANGAATAGVDAFSPTTVGTVTALVWSGPARTRVEGL